MKNRLECVKSKLIDEFIKLKGNNLLKYENQKELVQKLVDNTYSKENASIKLELSNLIYISDDRKYCIDSNYNLILLTKEGIFTKKYSYILVDIFSSTPDFLNNILQQYSFQQQEKNEILQINHDYVIEHGKIIEIENQHKLEKAKEHRKNLFETYKDIAPTEHDVCHFLYSTYNKLFWEHFKIRALETNPIEFLNNTLDSYVRKNSGITFVKISQQKRFEDKYKQLTEKEFESLYVDIISKGFWIGKDGDKISRYQLDEENNAISVMEKNGIEAYQSDAATIEFAYIDLFESNAKARVLYEGKLEAIRPYIEEVVREIDKDLNGELDMLENDFFYDYIEKNKYAIQDINPEYIQKFVKINNYIKSKKKNIQEFFIFCKEATEKDDFDLNIALLKNQMNVYNQLQFHSMSMVTALLEKEMMIFYEIYETLDSLGIFNSNWENEVSSQLSHMNESMIRLEDAVREEFSNLRFSIDDMGERITDSLKNLTYVTGNSISKLTNTMNTRLKEINHSIDTNNLLTLINTYQVYKVNKNTKSLKQ